MDEEPERIDSYPCAYTFLARSEYGPRSQNHIGQPTCPAKFTDHFLAEHMNRVSLSFLVDSMDKRRGGCAPNIAYTLALLGERPLLMATAGEDFGEYRQWLEAAGVPIPSLEKRSTSFYGAQAFEAAAAVAGQGVAILTPDFYPEELASGKLIRPFELQCTDGRGYWLAYPESRRNVPKIKAFRNWILEEMNLAGSDGS